MYHIVVSWDVRPDRRDDFMAAAFADGAASVASEPGIRQFELIADEANPNRFYLNEAYADAAAFDAHAAGQNYERFFHAIRDYAEGPGWLLRGSSMERPARSGPASTSGLRYADHVALRVTDYDESLGFYTGKLGFRVETEWTLGAAMPGIRFAYLSLGSFKIELIGDGQPVPAVTATDIGGHLGHCGYIHLCLRVEDLDTTVAELRRRDVEIFAEPFVVEPIGQRLAMIKDNSGNVIELAQAVTD